MTAWIALASVTLSSPVTLRLNLHAGQQFFTTLSIETENYHSTSFKFHYEVEIADKFGYMINAKFVGLTIDGKDRSADLFKVLPNPVVRMPWTRSATLGGRMSDLEVRESKDTLLMQAIGEAGLYLCAFPTTAITQGESWQGSTTATGGCTSATFTLSKFDRGHAYVNLSKVALRAASLKGAFLMVVDIQTGLPKDVSYTVVRKSGRVSHIRQRLDKVFG